MRFSHSQAFYDPMGKRLSHHPFTVESPVRIRVGSPNIKSMVSEVCRKLLQKTGVTSIYADMAERFKAAVLKTVEGNTSLGSNPSVRAK